MDVNTLSTIINVSTIFLFGLIWLGIVTFLRLKEKVGFVYLLFFTIFYVYLFEVLNITEFQFQSLLLLNYLSPGHLMLRGVGNNLNLTPLITLTLKDLETSLLNVLMLMPFGFGLPFITNFRMRKVVVVGALFSIGIELLQLITGLLGKSTFRIADINDVIFNTVGVVIGYILFVWFMHIYALVFRDGKRSTNPVLRYIALQPQVNSRSSMMSKNIFITALIVLAVAAAAFYGHTIYEKSNPQASIGAGGGGGHESAVPQSGDLCDGTGGNGQIESVGNNEFTIKQYHTGTDRLVHLAGGATIETSTGPVSLSDLKVGDRVTLVGGPNPDGSFTANTVVVCS